MKKLPFVQNPDKANHEKWKNTTNPINFPHPYRAIITGLPNSGKSSLVLNILLAAKPEFDNLFLIHPESFDSNASEADELKNKDILIAEKEIAEYAGVKWTGCLRYFPSETYFDEIKGKKNLLIIDDVELRNYVKKRGYREKRVNKLLSYTSTHRSLSIILTCQDIYSQVIPCVYRFSNIFILFKFRDKNQIQYLSRNIGIDRDIINALMSILKGTHDSICIDNTTDSPYPFRFNIINPVEVIESD